MIQCIYVSRYWLYLFGYPNVVITYCSDPLGSPFRKVGDCDAVSGSPSMRIVCL
jgi:hypothetical protein